MHCFKTFTATMVMRERNGLGQSRVALVVAMLIAGQAFAASPANIPYLKSGEVVPSVPDFTAGDPIGTTHDWNLGPTGARGWMWGWLLRTDLARQIYVTSVAAGSPAASGNTLKAGDVILGINGSQFTSDARIALGNAITEAEKTANSGVLRLTRWRTGVTSTVTINLPVKGDYSVLSPVACAKSTAVMQSACQYIVNKGLTKDIQGYINALGLLATGDAQYATLLRTYARSLTPNTGTGAWNWDPAYMNVFLCEYYLATSDAEVLPEINHLSLFLANGQCMVGSWGHGPAYPNHIIGGYGTLNSVGVVCAISLALAKKCGVNDPVVNQAITKAADFFRRFVGCGTIPYGDHTAPQFHDENGKGSMAAVFYDLIGETEATTHFARMTVASYGLRELGHTGNFWSYVWGPLGAQRTGPDGAAAFLREQYWFYDLERRWDGGFTYQGGADMSGSEHTTPGWDTTGARVLMYAMPLKKLYITGKSPSSAPALTGTNLDKTILSGRDFNPWYAMNKLTRDSYDDLSDAELLARLDTWSCEQRDRAAQALGRRTNPPIADYRNMVKSTNRDTILGGLYGLRYMGTAALPAMADVQPLLTHEDMWTQYQAGKVMCAIGAPARDITASIGFNVASSPTATNDPRQFRQRFATYNLWGNGWLEGSSTGIVNSSAVGDFDPVSLVPAVRKTMRHEHSVPRLFLANWLNQRSFNEITPFLFDILYGVENQAPTAVMWNHESRNTCLDILSRNRFKETVDAAATYVETMKNHGAEYRMGEVMNVLVGFGTEAKRVLPRLYAARTYYLQNWGPGKPYEFPQWAMDEMMLDLNNGITAIENATVTPTDLKTIYDYSISVVKPPSASPNITDVGMPTTLSVTAIQCQDLPISYTWSKLSGPGNVNFGSANAAQTTATFSQVGLYEVRVTISDGIKQIVNDITITVTQGIYEYLGHYKRLPVGNDWHIGWIEFASGKLQWRNQAGVKWNLLASAQSDVLVTDSTCLYGAGLTFTFSRVGGRISQFVFNGDTFVRQSPVAVGASLTTLLDVPLPVTLTASDPQSDPITYTVLIQPAHGTLSGTIPNLTYTPASGYLGTDSFTFKANDTESDSNVATISITVRTNIAPTVNAGPDQGAYLIEGTGSSGPVSGAWFEWDAAKDVAGDATWPSSTANTYTWTFDGGALSPVSVSDARFDKLTKAYALPAAKDVNNTNWDALGSNQSATFEFVVDADTDDGLLFESGGSTGLQFDISGGALRGCIKGGGTFTVSYPLTATDKGRFIHAVFVITISNKFELYVDGVLKQSVAIATTDWSGTDAAGLGNSSSTAPNGNKVDFTGKLALFRYYKAKALSATEVITNFNALSNGVAATVNLDGTVTDPDDTNPAKSWSVASTTPSGLNVQFGNASAVDTTATFTQPGTYTLRLMANDGIAAPVTDDIIITVYNDALPATYATWAFGIFNNNFTDKAIGSDPDGDKRSNLMEFAFGTDPTRMDMGSLAIDGSRHGEPVPVAASGGVFDYYFVRRKDHSTRGSVTYTVCFSDNLTTFYDNSPANTIFVEGPSSSNAAYEVVRVRFPNSLPNGQPARFARLRLDATP
jgi:Family of unknown function (DUF6288)/Bacterial Ig domain